MAALCCAAFSGAGTASNSSSASSGAAAPTASSSSSGASGGGSAASGASVVKSSAFNWFWGQTGNQADSQARKISRFEKIYWGLGVGGFSLFLFGRLSPGTLSIYSTKEEDEVRAATAATA